MAGAPHAGVHWEHRGLRFEIVDMDGDRIDKILVSVVSEERSGAD